MRYRIIGADEETGRATEMVTDAATPSQAEEIARTKGILIERLELADQPPLQPTHYTDDAVPVNVRNTTTIQQTSKRYKGIQLVSILVLLVGMTSCMVSMSGSQGGEPGAGVGFGSLLFILGLCGYLFARFGAWWNHG